MNVERLYSVAKVIVDDLASTSVLSVISQISQSLQQIMSQQNNGTHRQQLTTQLEQLKQKCAESKMNEFPPLWQQTAFELGIDLFGNDLYEEVYSQIQTHQLTIPEGKKAVDEINSKLNTRNQALTQMVKSFETLQIESDFLESGQCELGIMIPRDFVKNDLDSLSEEFEELSELFKVFDELATGSRSGFKVRSISSSDFGLYIAAAAPVALLISKSIDKLMSAYRNYWEVKKIKMELHEKNIPNEKLSELDAHIESIVKTSIKELVGELIQEAPAKIESGRKNELKIELNLSLNKLANRLDRGFNVEVRVNPPQIEDPDDDENELSEEQENEIQVYEQIKEHTSNFSFIENKGEPIIFLAESVDDLKKEGSSSNKTTKKKTAKKATKKKTH